MSPRCEWVTTLAGIGGGGGGGGGGLLSTDQFSVQDVIDWSCITLTSLFVFQGQ